jgi:hypothetical protein
MCRLSPRISSNLPNICTSTTTPTMDTMPIEHSIQKYFRRDLRLFPTRKRTLTANFHVLAPQSFPRLAHSLLRTFCLYILDRLQFISSVRQWRHPLFNRHPIGMANIHDRKHSRSSGTPTDISFFVIFMPEGVGSNPRLLRNTLLFLLY